MYPTTALDELCEQLVNDFYSKLDSKCDQCRGVALKLREQELLQNSSIYSNLCLAFVEELRHCGRERQAKLVPYMLKLHAKSVEQHDCRHCTGWCGMGHATQLLEIESSHAKLRELLYRLHKVALPLLEESDYPSQYAKLRLEILLLERLVAEMFLLEEGYLVPLIRQAQKKIHAQD